MPQVVVSGGVCEPVVDSDDVQEVLYTKFRATLSQVATDNGGEKLNVANPNRKCRTTPNIKVEEKVGHELPVLLMMVAEQLNQLLYHYQRLYC